ncbi:MAG TPA: hypothetical protein PKI68_01095 [Pontiellaceae bacterium]|nr:hypothetical protein [Pontiellaceae bacterium]
MIAFLNLQDILFSVSAPETRGVRRLHKISHPSAIRRGVANDGSPFGRLCIGAVCRCAEKTARLWRIADLPKDGEIRYLPRSRKAGHGSRKPLLEATDRRDRVRFFYDENGELCRFATRRECALIIAGCLLASACLVALIFLSGGVF